jgi:hypothetical protein
MSPEEMRYESFKTEEAHLRALKPDPCQLKIKST